MAWNKNQSDFGINENTKEECKTDTHYPWVSVFICVHNKVDLHWGMLGGRSLWILHVWGYL